MVTLERPLPFAGQRIEGGDPSTSSPKNSPPRLILKGARENIHTVAAYSEGAAVKINIVALVLQIHQLFSTFVLRIANALLQRRYHAEIAFHTADAVDTGHGGNHYTSRRVSSERVAERRSPVDLLVDSRVFFM